MPSSCVCVCVSVTLRYCIKTAKCRIMQIMPHDRSATLVYTDKRVVRSLCHSRATCDTIPEFDRHTHRQTIRHTTTAYTALYIASRGKNRPYCTVKYNVINVVQSFYHIYYVALTAQSPAITHLDTFYHF